jgi:hypothetical protein
MRLTCLVAPFVLLASIPALAEHPGLPAGFWDARVALAPEGGSSSVPQGTVKAAPRVEAPAPAKAEAEEPLPQRKAPRSYYTLRGGGDLGPVDSGLSAGVGFPRVDVNYYFNYAPGLDFSPEVSFLYGLGATVPVMGATAGTEVRWQIWQQGRWRLKLYGEPAAVMLFDPEVALGLRLGAPGVEATWHGMEGGYVHLGARMSPILFFSPSFLVSMPFVATVGGELQVYDDYNLYVELEAGPDVRKASGSAAETYLYVSSVVGVLKRF